MFDNDYWVVSWQEEYDPSRYQRSRSQVFDSNGNKVGTTEIPNETSSPFKTHEWYPRVGTIGNDDFVVNWRRNGGVTLGWDIAIQRYKRVDGSKVDSQVNIDDYCYSSDGAGVHSINVKGEYIGYMVTWRRRDGISEIYSTVVTDEEVICSFCENENYLDHENCSTCRNKWDISTNCTSCISYWDSDKDCNDCVGNRDKKGDCLTCLTNWNISTNCTTCIDGVYGTNCDYWYCYGIINNHSNVCSNHGICLKENHCDCLDFWKGETCNVTSCFGLLSNESNVCSNHGDCKSPNSCNCLDGWNWLYCNCSTGYIGIDCDIPICYNISASNKSVCSNHGFCVSPNNCSCENGYFDEECNNWECYFMNKDSPDVCNLLNGSCIGYNNCSCDPNFYGDECEDWDCDFINKDNETACNSHGKCVLPDECSCNPLYYDKYCNNWDCLFDCSNHGDCISPNNCSCYEHYTMDPFCSYWECFGTGKNDISVCSNGNGTCDYYNHCSCTSEYFGSNCELYYCFGREFNQSDVCSNHGLCTAQDQCSCYNGYYSFGCHDFDCEGVFYNSLIYVQQNMNWNDASLYCSSQLDGYLVSIHSYEKDQEISDLISSNIWMGLKKSSEKGDFEWIDGLPIYYDHWDVGSQLDEWECAQMTTTGVWIPVDCSLTSYFVCEIPLTREVFHKNEIETCSNHGSCQSSMDCKCQQGYINEDLACGMWYCGEYLNIDLERVCSNKGRCVKPNECECFEGFAGSECEKISHICYGKIAPEACSNGKGHCIKRDTCQCKAYLTGNECETILLGSEQNDIFNSLVKTVVALIVIVVLGLGCICCFGFVGCRKYNKYSTIEERIHDEIKQGKYKAIFNPKFTEETVSIEKEKERKMITKNIIISLLSFGYTIGIFVNFILIIIWNSSSMNYTSQYILAESICSIVCCVILFIIFTLYLIIFIDLSCRNKNKKNKEIARTFVIAEYLKMLFITVMLFTIPLIVVLDFLNTFIFYGYVSPGGQKVHVFFGFLESISFGVFKVIFYILIIPFVIIYYFVDSYGDKSTGIVKAMSIDEFKEYFTKIGDSVPVIQMKAHSYHMIKDNSGGSEPRKHFSRKVKNFYPFKFYSNFYPQIDELIDDAKKKKYVQLLRIKINKFVYLNDKLVDKDLNYTISKFENENKNFDKKILTEKSLMFCNKKIEEEIKKDYVYVKLKDSKFAKFYSNVFFYIMFNLLGCSLLFRIIIEPFLSRVTLNYTKLVSNKREELEKSMSYIQSQTEKKMDKIICDVSKINVGGEFYVNKLHLSPVPGVLGLFVNEENRNEYYEKKNDGRIVKLSQTPLILKPIPGCQNLFINFNGVYYTKGSDGQFKICHKPLILKPVPRRTNLYKRSDGKYYTKRGGNFVECTSSGRVINQVQQIIVMDHRTQVQPRMMDRDTQVQSMSGNNVEVLNPYNVEIIEPSSYQINTNDIKVDVPTQDEIEMVEIEGASENDELSQLLPGKMFTSDVPVQEESTKEKFYRILTEFRQLGLCDENEIDDLLSKMDLNDEDDLETTIQILLNLKEEKINSSSGPVY